MQIRKEIQQIKSHLQRLQRTDDIRDAIKEYEALEKKIDKCQTALKDHEQRITRQAETNE